MSESENKPLPPPSTPKTAAVPLKKETVRITLRARPGAGATQPRDPTAPVTPVAAGIPAPDLSPKRSTAPIQLPSAPLPPPAPRAATAQVKLPPAPMAVSRKTTSAIPVLAMPATPSAPPAGVPMPPPPRPLGAPPVPRPPAPPAATVPLAAPAAPSMPGAPRPPGVPGAPPAAPGAPRPLGAPPVAGAPMPPRPPGVPGAPVAPRAPGAPGAPVAPVAPGAPRMETGATTAPLGPKPGAPVRPAVSAPRAPGTAPLTPAAGTATGALPKATVKLQQTQPMARPSASSPPSAPVKRAAASDSQQFYEDKDPEEGLMPLSVVCLLFSAVLLLVQMFGSDRIASSAESPIMVPPAESAEWENKSPEGAWGNNFKSKLPPLPQ